MNSIIGTKIDGLHNACRHRAASLALPLLQGPLHQISLRAPSAPLLLHSSRSSDPSPLGLPCQAPRHPPTPYPPSWHPTPRGRQAMPTSSQKQALQLWLIQQRQRSRGDVMQVTQRRGDCRKAELGRRVRLLMPCHLRLRHGGLGARKSPVPSPQGRGVRGLGVPLLRRKKVGQSNLHLALIALLRDVSRDDSERSL